MRQRVNMRQALLRSQRPGSVPSLAVKVVVYRAPDLPRDRAASRKGVQLRRSSACESPKLVTQFHRQSFICVYAGPVSSVSK